MADPDIEFGAVEQARREQCLRPDRNKHYAVVACESPDESDLPVFVDLDTLRDIEAHALSDTSVELGGVLLGGQYEDKDGKPFVMVVDSLRAEHYQSSKGSFKFTHDTWSQITRQRDGFPDDLQMVGWYHTHPDWGVFLSNMDMFICDHFFNRRLDVALVVDPCRGDRGWFQWTDDPDERTRRTGGYYVIASRHRRLELEMSAAQLEGKFTMANDPRLSGFPAPYPVPMVAPGDTRLSWQGVAVIGMLTMQFLFLALIAWRMIVPSGADTAGEKDRPSKQVAALVERLDRLVEAERRSQEIDGQLQVLDRVVSQLGDGTPEGVVRLLAEAERENETLKTDARVYRALEEKVNRDNEALASELKASRDDATYLSSRITKLDQTISEHEDREKQYREQIASLEKKLKSYQEPDAVEKASEDDKRRIWIWGSVGLVVVALVALGVIMGFSKRETEDDMFEETDEGVERASDDEKEEP
jgi:proteasome lid subunit RPN8/RPN11